jgi:hypothetical protein
MKTLLLFPALLGLATTGLFAQTYGNITVTGTASANELDVTGLFDLQGNTSYFGSDSSGQPGATFIYSDGTTGTGAFLTNLLTRPAAAWNWQRQGASAKAMELDPANRLLLTGTQTLNPGSIILNPSAGQITLNGQQVLTNGGSGLSIAGSGYVGIGTTNPTSTLDVNGIASANQFALSGPNGYSAQNSPDPGSGEASFLISTEGGPLFDVDQWGEVCVYGSSAFIAVTDRAWGPSYRTGFYSCLGTLNFFSNPLYQNTLSIGSLTGNITLGHTNYGYDGNYTPSSTVTILGSGDTSSTSSLNIQNSDGASGFYVQDDGNVGIGTSTPQATLDVNGSANFSGPVEIQPQGDLSMGSFTATPAQTTTGNAMQSAPALGRGTFKAPVLSGSTTVSGTSTF